ncbi:XrtA/PEP-CTERM system TPR-repeat protein PrsT [Congregibacter litoralis]|uniref:Putative PEP-CTERM system TPR-repeat protein lipoprotein n=1 Tax=Congregibacter litoralis KT71 TaxID=314285 RepID=A4A578_9GAMM|nr:XrtA/PEP-CTERM system TPR-repeat protein PrsT [Congregibacter litoralis]EAQ98949.1 putative PEP-CTERM system TPR-repeat protein lipoprotein [Congregibacter litoralis KT71]
MFDRSGYAIGIGLLMALLVACSGSENESEQKLLARASSALEAGKIDAAMVDLKTALQQNPGSAAARVLLGDAYMVQREAEMAAAEFLRAHEIGGQVDSQVRYAQALIAAGDTDTLLTLHESDDLTAADAPLYQAALARAYSLTGNYEAATEAVNRALAADAADPYIRSSEALVLLRQGGNVFGAADILAGITDDYPLNDEAWSLRADVARYQQDYASAAKWYGKVAEINPDRIAERLHLVGALIELGRSDEADSKLAELEELELENPGVNFARGRLLFDKGEYSLALEELNQVLGVLPEHTAALYLAATANLQQGNLATAERQLIKLVAEQPSNVPARLQLASVYLQRNDALATERVAREILQLEEKNIAAMRLLALALVAQGEYVESEQLYQQLATLKPDSVEDRTGLGATQLLLGDTASGIVELEKALAMDPKNAQLRERLIGAYLASDRIDLAREAVAGYQSESPDDTRPQIFAARFALQTGERDKAREIFESVLVKEPGNINANGGLAIMALNERNIDEARQHFYSILEFHPTNVQTLMNLATLEEQAGNTDAMLDALNRAMSADPQALPPRLALARYEIIQENPRKAEALLDTVREHHTNSFELHQLLAAAFMASRQTTQAVTSGRQMLRLRPNDPASLAYVARLEQNDGQLGAAREHAERVLALTSDNVEMRKLIVETLLAQNMPNRAAAELAKLPSTVRAAPGVAKVEGQLAMLQDRPADAEVLFQRAFEIEPDSQLAVFLNIAKWEQDKRKEAIDNLEAWLTEHPDDLAVRSKLAAWQLAVGNEKRAKAHYNFLIEIAPENPMVLNNLAWLNRETSPELALNYAKKAHALAPESVLIMDTYAMVQRSIGNKEEALALSDLALSTDKKLDPELQFNRALILIDADREEDAIEILAKLVAGAEFAQQSEARALLGSILSDGP